MGVLDGREQYQQDEYLQQGTLPESEEVFAGIESKVTRYEWGKEVAPGITSIATPGHTPGHTSFAIASGSARILAQCDVTNIPSLFLTHPDWQLMYDNDPQLAFATRRKLGIVIEHQL